jgi:hypothetical protein
MLGLSSQSIVKGENGVRSHRKWTITGRSYLRAGMKRHSNAAGSRTSMAFHGKLFPVFCSIMINDPDSEKSQRAIEAMLQMKKIDIDELKRAYAG